MDAKALQDDLEWCLGFTPCLAKPEIGKEVGRRRARSKDKKVKRVRVSHMGSKEASERRSGTGEDERQPVMAQLPTWWRRFQFGDIGSA